MKNQLIITDPERVQQIKNMYHERNSERDGSFQYVACEYLGEWRWGAQYLLVIQDRADKKLWGTVVNAQIQDEYRLSFDDETSITLRPVEEVQDITYRLIK